MNLLQTYPMALDVTMIVLLVVTMGYVVILNRKIAVLSGAKKDLEGLLKSFSEVSEKAGADLASLKTEAAELGDALENQVEDALRAAEDIHFLTRKGDAVADRLEGSAVAASQSGAAAVAYAGQSGGGFTTRSNEGTGRLSPAAFRIVSNGSEEMCDADKASRQPTPETLEREALAQRDSGVAGKMGLSVGESQLLKAFQSIR